MATLTLTRSAGMLLLGIWLILTGIGALAPLPIPGIVPGTGIHGANKSPLYSKL